MQDSVGDTELTRRFREAQATHHPRAPLYAALSAGIARDIRLARLLAHAPPTQRLPVLLFACVHALVLAEPDHELAQWYPNLTVAPRRPTDPELMPTFTAFVEEHLSELTRMLETRQTQTNEVGRCAMLLPPLAMVAAETGAVTLLDVGSSGGLNLLLDRYEYRYAVPRDPDVGDEGGDDTAGEHVHVVGGPSAVVLDVSVRGRLDLPAAVPPIAARCGVDVTPIDITDDGEARWLEACVWPDQADRFHRLHEAILIARAAPPELLAGDAVASVEPAIERLARSGHPVVVNSWVLNYLPAERRSAYVAELDVIGAARDLSWIFVESPEMTPELPWPALDAAHERLTVTTLVRWRSGQRTVEPIAVSHPHGFWIHGLGHAEDQLN